MRISLVHLIAAAVLALLVAPSSDALALNPSRTYKQLPDKYNMQYEATTVPTDDGAVLNVWSFKARVKTRRYLLVAHNGEGNMGDYLRRVDAFLSFANVVTFDYRGYGESSELEIDKRMAIYPQFLYDMKAMIDYVRKTHSATFSIYGWGIGGGLALGVGYGRPEVCMIIADTPFLSIDDLEERMSSWDEPLEVPFVGYEQRYEPKSAVLQEPGKNLTTVKLIVGSNDRLYKVTDMKALAASQKRFIDNDIYVVKNPDRKDNFAVATAAYTEVVKKTLVPKAKAKRPVK